MFGNNSDFWDGAYRDNAPSLLGVVRRYVKDESIAEDLVHETFIAAIAKYDSYSGKGSFEGWLYRIAVNTALMFLRSERNNIVLTGQAMSLLSAEELDNDDDNEQSDNARTTIEAAGFSSEELLAAIDRLPEHHKLVFNMFVMDDFSHKQIAAELNISQGTSKSHLKRARKKIQHFLYEEAMNRKKIKDKRRVSAFLLLFPAKTHYIDRLYRDGLSNFRIPPTTGSEFLASAIKQHAASNAANAAMPVVQTATFWGTKLSYITIGCTTAAITVPICWLSMSINSPIYNNYDSINPNYDTIIMNDSIVNSNNVADDAYIIFDNENMPVNEANNNDSVPKSNEPAPDMQPEPVIIKKQIIKHQTVVVRDTIYIEE